MRLRGRKDGLLIVPNIGNGFLQKILNVSFLILLPLLAHQASTHIVSVGLIIATILVAVLPGLLGGLCLIVISIRLALNLSLGLLIVECIVREVISIPPFNNESALESFKFDEVFISLTDSLRHTRFFLGLFILGLLILGLLIILLLIGSIIINGLLLSKKLRLLFGRLWLLAGTIRLQARKVLLDERDNPSALTYQHIYEKENVLTLDRDFLAIALLIELAHCRARGNVGLGQRRRLLFPHYSIEVHDGMLLEVEARMLVEDLVDEKISKYMN